MTWVVQYNHPASISYHILINIPSPKLTKKCYLFHHVSSPSRLARPVWSCAQRAWPWPFAPWSSRTWARTPPRLPRGRDCCARRRRPCGSSTAWAAVRPVTGSPQRGVDVSKEIWNSWLFPGKATSFWDDLGCLHLHIVKRTKKNMDSTITRWELDWGY